MEKFGIGIRSGMEELNFRFGMDAKSEIFDVRGLVHFWWHPWASMAVHGFPNIFQEGSVPERQIELISLRDSRRGNWRLRGVGDGEIWDWNQIWDGIIEFPVLVSIAATAIAGLPMIWRSGEGMEECRMCRGVWM